MPNYSGSRARWFFADACSHSQIQNAEKIASGEIKPPDYFAPEEEFPMSDDDEFEDVTVSLSLQYCSRILLHMSVAPACTIVTAVCSVSLTLGPLSVWSYHGLRFSVVPFNRPGEGLRSIFQARYAPSLRGCQCRKGWLWVDLETERQRCR